MILLAQIFKIIGSIFNLIADKANNTKKIFIFNSISNLFNGVQYFLLNAITGAISSILAILRNIVLFKYKNDIKVIDLIIYFMIIILFNIYEFTNIISIIPVLLVIIYSTALYTNKILNIKYSIIIVCILEIIYDYIYYAYVGIIVCIIDIIITTISIKELKKEEKL